METYYLDTLLTFLKVQKWNEYEAIKMVLSILDDTTISEEGKKMAIVHVLRKHGLNELTYKKGRYDSPLDHCSVDQPVETKSHDYRNCFMGQLIWVHFEDAEVMIEICLN